jgi:homoserine O-acetyltransferase/O-succinyltransferase
LNYELFRYNEPFTLESSKTLTALHLAYTTIGELNEEKDNAVWVFHALTANSDPSEWWSGLIGEEKLLDPNEYFIVCANMPGSCYGSIGPLDVDAKTREPFYHDFPLFTTRDMVRAYKHLRTHLGIEKIYIGIGGSMGGQQLLEWAVEEPLLFEYIIPIATNAQHSAWGIAFNASQRWCIENDTTWIERNDDAGLQGMKLARSVALLSYRNYETYENTQEGFTDATKTHHADEQVFKAESYQHYQGEKLAKRFNAFSYYFLSKGMDSHDISRTRGTMKDVLQTIKATTLIISIASDILFPPKEQEFLAKYIQDAELTVIDSFYGHDGFLLEYEKITAVIKHFLNRQKVNDSRKIKQII